jgi:outer membrane protein
MFKKAIMCATVAALGAAYAASAQAEEEGKWLVRGRALYLKPANKSDAGNGNAGITSAVLPADSVVVNSKTFPELDITYFFTRNIAAELVLTYPQKQDVHVSNGPLNALGSLGTFKHLPPTLSLQYHFLPDGTFRPYVGVGVNYTRISNVSLNAGASTLQLDNSSVGLSYGAGFDVRIAKQWFLNLDVKKINIESDLKLNGTKISHLKLDPLAVSVGVGYRF